MSCTSDFADAFDPRQESRRPAPPCICRPSRKQAAHVRPPAPHMCPALPCRQHTCARERDSSMFRVDASIAPLSLNCEISFLRAGQRSGQPSLRPSPPAHNNTLALHAACPTGEGAGPRPQQQRCLGFAQPTCTAPARRAAVPPRLPARCAPRSRPPAQRAAAWRPPARCAVPAPCWRWRPARTPGQSACRCALKPCPWAGQLLQGSAAVRAGGGPPLHPRLFLSVRPHTASGAKRLLQPIASRTSHPPAWPPAAPPAPPPAP